MKTNFFLFLLTTFLFLSCQQDETKIKEERLRDAKKKELVFATINKAWNFSNPPLNPKAQEIIKNWAELRIFNSELSQKPKSTIGAFQRKSKELSKRAADLNNNIPAAFSKPEIKTRIMVLNTKINSLNLYLNLPEIQDKKVSVLVAEINQEMVSFYQQMDEIIRKTEIPKEIGEPEFVHISDTSRAIPTNPKKINFPQSE